MTHRLIFVSGILALLALAGCGGGSSSGAGTQAGPAPTAFAGTYKGQMTITIQGVTAADPVTITVAPNGRVDLETGGGGAACIEDPSPSTPFLAGDTIAVTGSGRCFIQSVGTCDVNVSAEIQFTRTEAVGDGRFRFQCTQGTFNGTMGIGAVKI